MIAKSSIEKVDTDLTTMINGMLHIPILCISLVLVVIIVQHALFLWYLSFRFSGRVFIMYNGISMAGALLFDGNLRGKGVISGDKKSQRLFYAYFVFHFLCFYFCTFIKIVLDFQALSVP